MGLPVGVSYRVTVRVRVRVCIIAKVGDRVMVEFSWVRFVDRIRVSVILSIRVGVVEAAIGRQRQTVRNQLKISANPPKSTLCSLPGTTASFAS